MSLYDLEFIFKTTRAESMPLLKERLDALHEVGKILLRDWRGSFENVVAKANGSAVKLVQLIVDNFPPFRDVSTFRGHQGVA